MQDININSPDLIDVDAACMLLKMKKQTIYKKISARKIPFMKMPGSNKVYFSKMGLYRWLNDTLQEGEYIN